MAGHRTDWATVDLPQAWPDVALERGLREALGVLGAVFRRRRRVRLPADLPGADILPGYLRLEFHHLPNGFYSKRLAAGYVRGFDALMLGHMRRLRARVAAALAGGRVVADVGCGAGGLAAALVAAGVPSVWAVEPSPYLLQLAARRVPGVRCVQGLAERTGFADGQCDGVGLTYVLHELPPRAADAALAELRRVLRPGGRLAFGEPSPRQYVGTAGALLREAGVAGLWYLAMARLVYEPFVAQWHRRDLPRWLAAGGFRVLEHDDGIPSRVVVAERV